MLEKIFRVTALWGRACLAAKSSQGQIWMGWLAPYSDPGPTVAQTRGRGSLQGSILFVA
jgi:hypothetical protein